MTKKGSKLNIFFLILVVLSAIIVSIPELGSSVFASEALIQFRVHISFLLFLLFLLLIIKSRYLLGTIQIALALFNIFPVMSLYVLGDKVSPVCRYDITQAPLRMLSFNVYYKNQYFDSIMQTLKIVDADIVLLQEAQSEFLEFGHGSLMKEYPFYYPEIGKGERVSWVLYSRYPIIDTKIQKFSQFAHSALYTKIDVEGKIVDLVGLHAQSPKTIGRIEARNNYINSLGIFVENIARENRNIIVAGDFNNVPWHPAMEVFIKRTSLNVNNFISNAFGTWPTWAFSLFTIPIDHIFHSNGFHNVTYQRSFPSGSDHYPIYADFYFCE